MSPSLIDKARFALKGLFSSPASVHPPTNVYHLTIPKAGSQWIRMIMADDRVRQACGLRIYTYTNHLPVKNDLRNIHERSFDEPFPEQTIVCPVYIDYLNFAAFPKPEDYRAFFMMRDPRDILVSYYYSMKESHKKIGGAYLDKIRAVLNSMPEPEGMVRMVSEMEKSGFFIALRSWIPAPEKDPNVMLVKYEDLAGNDSFEHFQAVFDHCRIPMETPTLQAVLDQYSFTTLSGRKPGEEDTGSHFRKGVAGDWQNYFDDNLTARFKEATGDLVDSLGYAW